ncbi:MAG: metal-dependent transcriptional regulator [candidate division Zixibacteria bacterium]|nr:metal-dependent transcriptional regulator [candidate division Zixibacteria bacterium]
MKLSSRKEDYLETIYRLSGEIDTVGISDIARERGVTLPTVNSAVASLKEEGYIKQRHYGKVILTSSGEAKAIKIYEAHLTIKRFLREILGLSEDLAESEACKMEHGLSRETMERLKHFIKTVINCRESKNACRTQFFALLKSSGIPYDK